MGFCHENVGVVGTSRLGLLNMGVHTYALYLEEQLECFRVLK
jgi:hypothetical protein